MSDPIIELVTTLAALRRDVDQLTRQSTETREAAMQAVSAAVATQKAAEIPRPIRVDASAVEKVLESLDTNLANLRQEIGMLDADHYRATVDATARTARAGLTRTAEAVEARLTAAVRTAESTIQSASAWMTWKLACVIGTVVVGAGFTLFAFAGASTWWQHQSRDQITVEIQRMRFELSQLQARAGEWEKRAGRATLRTCQDNPTQLGATRERLCVKVDTTAPRYGERSEYVVLDGY